MRGYPMSDFDRRAEDLTVDHATVVHHYRNARDITTLRHSRKSATTEDLRQAGHSPCAVRRRVELATSARKEKATDEPRLSTSDIAAADRHNTEAAARDRLEQERHEAEQRQGRRAVRRPDQQALTDAPTPLFVDDEPQRLPGALERDPDRFRRRAAKSRRRSGHTGRRADETPGGSLCRGTAAARNPLGAEGPGVDRRPPARDAASTDRSSGVF